LAASTFICEEVGNQTSQHHVLAQIWPRNYMNVNAQMFTHKLTWANATKNNTSFGNMAGEAGNINDDDDDVALNSPV